MFLDLSLIFVLADICSDHYFINGYFNPTSRPSFGLPWAYHYADRPDQSALRIRQVVYGHLNADSNKVSRLNHNSIFNFHLTGRTPQIVASDPTGAMAALSVFHILGLYPVPVSWQLLISSPLISSYSITNEVFGTVTQVTVKGFDNATLTAAPPSGSRVYVKSITVNGQPTISVCWISFQDLVGGGNIVIEVDSDAAGAAVRGCGGHSEDAKFVRRGNKRGTQSLPDSP